MSTPFTQQQVRVRTAVLLFLKGAAAPLVLYFEKPLDVYEEIRGLMQSATPRLYEKETIGPIKKFSVFTSQISAIALQEEQFI